MKILTFDIEEWFHILDYSSLGNTKEWSNYESRIEANMEIIFEIMKGSNVSATFFVIGWIADKYPNIIKKISNLGFEIGSHSHFHQLSYELDRNAFYNDVKRSIKSIEDSTGKKVKSFRAPGFSITEKNKWAFEALHQLGIEIDCSVFPAKRAHGGLPKYQHATPSILKCNGIQLKEFPINTFNIFKQSVVFSGGGYFRLLPYSFINIMTKKSNYVMSYFHPRDFDHSQKILPNLSLARRFKSYIGLKNCRPKLERWLSDFDFIDLDTANNKVDWEAAPVINL
tara:strand:- start:430 stop:1278 length:849 start_codon:yes stop_codon:yes gene_type:complete